MKHCRANRCWSSCFVTGTSVEVASSLLRWPFLWKKEKRRCVIVAVLRNHQSQKTKRRGGRGGGLVLLVVISSLCCSCLAAAHKHLLSFCNTKRKVNCVISCTRVCSEERHLWTWLRCSDTLPPRALLCHSATPPCLLTICDFVFPLSALTLCFFAADFDLAVQKCFWNAPPPRPKSPVLYFPPERLHRSTSVQFCHNSLSPFCALVLECVSVCGLLQNSERSWLHNSRVTLQ